MNQHVFLLSLCGHFDQKCGKFPKQAAFGTRELSIRPFPAGFHTDANDSLGLRFCCLQMPHTHVLMFLSLHLSSDTFTHTWTPYSASCAHFCALSFITRFYFVKTCFCLSLQIYEAEAENS